MKGLACRSGKKPNIKKMLLVLLMSFLIVCTSGCLFIGDLDFGTGNGSGGDTNSSANAVTNYLEGVKVAYKQQTQNYDSMFRDYSYSILSTLSKYYGITTDLNNNFGFGTDPETVNILLLDSICFQLTKTGENEETTYSPTDDTSWQWHLQKYPAGAYAQSGIIIGNDAYDEAYSAYLGNYLVRNAYYLNIFEQFFLEKLQIAMYQIVLGQTPTVYSVSGFNENGEPNIAGNSNVTLTQMQNAFKRRATYIGFSNSDKQKLYDYIINNVIGSVALGYSGDSDYVPNWDQLDNSKSILNNYPESPVDESYYPLDEENYNVPQKYYRYTVADILCQTIVGENPEDQEKLDDFFNPKSCCEVKDYPAGSFFLSGSGDAFKNQPISLEYQSLVLMPSKTDKLMSLWLAFESTTALSVRVQARVYNSTNNSYTSISSVLFNIPAGAYKTLDNSQTYMMNLADHIEVCDFDNKDDIKALAAKNLYEKPICNYYKLESSQNGFGGVAVLNPSQIEHSYVEIVFDVVKDAYAQDDINYEFKVGIVNLIYE